MNDKTYPYTQNRELSWLRFNQRVLEEAADPSVPLLERLKFLAIFTSNLDEFYMVRCGSLYDLSLIDGNKTDAKSGMTPAQQLEAVYRETRKLYAMKDAICKDIHRTLHDLYLDNLSLKELTKKQAKHMSQYFDQQVLPLLSPQIIDAHHPFPHLVNKEQYLFAELLQSGKKRFGIVPIPNFTQRILTVPNTDHDYILLEHLILQHADKIFPKCTVRSKTIIRITRNADINLNEKDIEEDEDYRQFMKKILKKRTRLSAIRLEVYKTASDSSIQYLCQHLKISPSQVFFLRSPLEMKHLYEVISQAPKTKTDPLLYPPYAPCRTNALNPDKPLIGQIMQGSVLLHYPYQTIDTFLELLEQASTDKNVISIKITIYRLASNSRIVQALAKAAENGKEVLVLMELRARFDEQNNIRAAEKLLDAGCTVIYGFEEYKVHSKICLITFTHRNEIRTITQIGTGNYNEKTSRLYTDFSYITANPAIGQDAQLFFRNMQISSVQGAYQKLLSSPDALKAFVLDQIQNQITLAKQGKPAQIRLKMNSVTDLDIIKALSQASQAGVSVTMVVRGICCLLPGMKNWTENIQIYSIVGRYLEHSRIYIFGPDEDCSVYISSADFMTRNTERRVEIAVPIEEPQLKQELINYFALLCKDNTKRRILMPSGAYKKPDAAEDEPLCAQDTCMRLAQEHVWVPEKKHFAALRQWLSSIRQ